MAAHIPEFSLLLLYHTYPFDLLPLLPHAYTCPVFRMMSKETYRKKHNLSSWFPTQDICPQTTRIKTINYQSDNTNSQAYFPMHPVMLLAGDET